jgi:cyclic pyranopterin phosphate synthase
VSPADGSRLKIVDDVGDDAAGAPLPARAAYSLRVSVLDACNLRCTYCAPGALAAPMSSSRWLSPAEHARLAPSFAAVPVKKVRFTGGEPLLRADLEAVVAAWRAALPSADLALTTNATRLVARVDALRSVGLDRVTVHLDTLREERYGALMGEASSVAQVLRALDVARARFAEVKLNVVVQRGRNDDELLDFVRWSRGSGAQVRFIELMRTGSADDVVDDAFFAGRDVVARLHARPLARRDASDPAALFAADVDGVDVVFGVIASDTEPFCGACDRLRLTADGRLRGCLYESGGVALGAALRQGVDDDALRALVQRGVRGKRSFHPLATGVARVPFSMADVGG